MAARLKQAVFCQGSRCDEAHHVTANNRFASSFLCFCGAFHLFTNGNPEPLANERQKVVFRCMVGHAAHGNIGSVMLATFCQSNVERFGGGHGIVKEEFVKITHTIEQQSIFVLSLDLKILRHHWCHENYPLCFTCNLQILGE